MPAFRFRFQPVLDQRKRAEEAIQREVAGVERERLALEERLRAAQAAISAEKRFQRDALTGLADLAAARARAASALAHDADARRLALDLAAVYRRLDEARGRLRLASARTKAVTLLRDRHRDAWLADLNRTETRALDDLAVMRAARSDGAP